MPSPPKRSDGSKLTGLTYTDRTTNESHQLDLEGIFVQIGLLPNTEWLEGTVELTPRKEIVINDRGETSVPGVFAAGDCTTTPYSRSSSPWAAVPPPLSAFDHLIRTSAPPASRRSSADPSTGWRCEMRAPSTHLASRGARLRDATVIARPA